MKYYKTRCPECGKEAEVMYTFHVKTVKTKCSCGQHKLFSNFVLALKKDEFTLVCPECGDVFKHNFKLDGPAQCKCGYVISNPKKDLLIMEFLHVKSAEKVKMLVNIRMNRVIRFLLRKLQLNIIVHHVNHMIIKNRKSR